MSNLVCCFKNYINDSKYRNVRFVHIKSDRKCMYCNSILNTGTECLTINTKFRGRSWVCTDCVSAVLEHIKVKDRLDNISFDDEGYWYAVYDNLLETVGELESRGILS